MSKSNLNILVNPLVDNSSYIDFLNESFNVMVHKYNPNDKLNLKEIDLVLFTGGEDVYPKLYNERSGKYTRYSEKRDMLERDMFNSSVNTPKLGICRGAQFLTVMNGGRLIQHVENHTSSHDVTFNLKNTYLPSEYKNFTVTSTHHQMMFPYSLPKEAYNVLAYSTHYLSDTYLNGANIETYINNIDFRECEIVRYDKTNSLCIQGHPEFKTASKEFKDITYYLIKQLL